MTVLVSQTAFSDVEQFTMHIEEDAPGYDYQRFDPPTLSYCQTRCAADSQCKAFTYNRVRHVCFLKSKSGFPLRPHREAITGRKTSANRFSIQVEETIERLIDRHGDGNFLDCTFKLTFPPNPNGIYLLKGGGPDVWCEYGVPRCWRKPQGRIHGKRCGTTENIGMAARGRLRADQDGNEEVRKRQRTLPAVG